MTSDKCTMKYHYNNRFFSNPVPCNGYLLLQTGELYCDENTVLGAHDQRCFELTYVTDGKGEIFSGENGTEVSENDCYISLKGDKHKIQSDKHNPLRFKFIAVEAMPGGERAELLKHLCNYLTPDHRCVNVPSLNDRFLRIFEELENKLVYYNDAIGNELTEMLIDIIRALERKTKKQYPVKIRDDTILVFHIVQYIDNNILTLKNLYELKNEFNYSYNYISAVFSKIMKMPIKEYFLRVKMNTAKRMLEEKNYSVTEVAESLNYSSIHTFSRSFKKYFGHSPNHFKSSVEKL